LHQLRLSASTVQKRQELAKSAVVADDSDSDSDDSDDSRRRSRKSRHKSKSESKASKHKRGSKSKRSKKRRREDSPKPSKHSKAAKDDTVEVCPTLRSLSVGQPGLVVTRDATMMV
jgi:hypothetical protein